MYFFRLKRNFKKISILIAVPYIALCITSGGLHSLDKRAYHGHVLKHNGSKNEYEKSHSHNNLNHNKTASFCFNDHNADKCGICKWLKNTTKKGQFAQRHSFIFQDYRKLCILDQSLYNFLKFHKNSPRSPPFSIS